ncbi:MAG: hypothetical protein ACRENS_03980 [Candidatus Eiseniibacteriota bacterium]
MELDDLKAVWAEHGVRLERSVRIHEGILRRMLLRRVRRALAPLVFSRALEVVFGVAALIVVLPILARHIAEPRYAVAVGALAALLAGNAAISAFLIVTSLRLDLDRPVIAIQRKIERIKLIEYGALKWAILGGVMLWLPAALVLFEAVTGVDALARVNFSWLLANLIFGFLVLGLGQVISKRYVERPLRSEWAGRILDALAGRATRAAEAQLAELSKFEREELPAS